ncbi:MAG TPA: efflux RND transporter periplasmic adaptor subunit [Opitutaceae bacterium]|nr:efflux RND transporter periplasmic adaptor subunit [Opitutaceae bacterium]
MSDKTRRSLLWLKIILAVAVLAAAGFAVLLSARPVAKVETVVSGEAKDLKPGSVTVKEVYSMQMKSEIAGRVLKEGYSLDPGMSVKEGDVLVHLDASDILIAKDQIQNQYDAVKQRIAVGSVQTYNLESAESDFKNTARLFNMGQVSDSDYQKARRAVETIKQMVALEKVTNEEDLKTDENTLRAKQSDINKMTIRAPFEGQVSYVYAHPGDLIDVGSPIVALITRDRLVEAKISEEDFANIKVGQPASVQFLPYGAWVYNGKVKKILPTADPETQRHLVDLTITDIEPEKLIPGITGEVTIVVGTRPAKAIIPRRALLNESVFVVKGGRVELRKVRKGYVWLTGAEILEGLEAGEQVIVEDLDSFRDGDRVRVEELPSDAFSKKK